MGPMGGLLPFAPKGYCGLQVNETEEAAGCHDDIWPAHISMCSVLCMHVLQALQHMVHCSLEGWQIPDVVPGLM